MAKKTNSKINAKRSVEPTALEQLELIALRLDKINSKTDALISLFLDFLLSSTKNAQPAPYTDKVAWLGELGMDIDVISSIVRRPSNYVSSRLRESKKRKFSMRQKRMGKAM